VKSKEKAYDFINNRVTIKWSINLDWWTSSADGIPIPGGPVSEKGLQTTRNRLGGFLFVGRAKNYNSFDAKSIFFEMHFGYQFGILH
jgi:hypothetical protein